MKRRECGFGYFLREASATCRLYVDRTDVLECGIGVSTVAVGRRYGDTGRGGACTRKLPALRELRVSAFGVVARLSTLSVRPRVVVRVQYVA